MLLRLRHRTLGVPRPADASAVALRRAEGWIRQSLRDLSIPGKVALDIGAGNGLFTCYLAQQGAEHVVALEPEQAGAGPHARATLVQRVRALGLGRVTCRSETFQEYDPGPLRFDVILAHDVINHLNEPAVRVLTSSPAARAEYLQLLRRMHDLLRPGGVAIIADCARSNFFADLGLPNPFAGTIEWEKHQNPSLWCELLVEAGFQRPRLHWTYPSSLGPIGWLLSRPGVAYMLESHFVLHATRPPSAVQARVPVAV